MHSGSLTAQNPNTNGLPPRLPSAEAERLQRILHEKFVSQRRKDALSDRRMDKRTGLGTLGLTNLESKTHGDTKVNSQKQRKSKATKVEHHSAESATKSQARPQEKVDRSSAAKGTSKALRQDMKEPEVRGQAGGKQKAMASSVAKTQKDRGTDAQKREPKSVKKKRLPIAAAQEPSTQIQGKKDEYQNAGSTSKASTQARKQAPVSKNDGEGQIGKVMPGASSIAKEHASSLKQSPPGKSRRARSSRSEAEMQPKDRSKETMKGKKSVGQQPSLPEKQQPVKKISSQRRLRKKENSAKTGETRRASVALPSAKTVGGRTRRVLSTARAAKRTMTIRKVMARLRSVVSQPATKSLTEKDKRKEVKGQSLSCPSKLGRAEDIQRIQANELNMSALDIEQPPVPHLSYGLERVLFNPGVYYLQDPRSRVYNFDPYLQTIMPVKEFDFNALKEYITSSRDTALQGLAESYKKRYVGSSSSMTGVLAHFHFLLSQWRAINTKMLSREFPDEHITEFTRLQRSPAAIFLKWRDGSYAIDADKEFANANVLMLLGKSMEKLLTLDTEAFEKYRKSNPDKVSEEERKAPEAYHYSTMGDFIMRSQLDAHDSRLPGTGMFDLKTRAVVSVRMEASKYEEGSGYQIRSRQGAWESFEREYFDMIRSAFLKYSLQVRMGRMDGIFVAFHNTDRIFGFQYVSLAEMDSTLHGQWETTLGDQEFKFSVALLNDILDKATKKYPNTSLRLHFETREALTPFMYIFAEPVTEEQVTAIQTARNAQVRELEEELYGNKKVEDENEGEDQSWERLQANVQDSMDEDIRDPTHWDGQHGPKPISTTMEQSSMKPDPASASNVCVHPSESADAEVLERGEVLANGPKGTQDSSDQVTESTIFNSAEGEVEYDQGAEDNVTDRPVKSQLIADRNSDTLTPQTSSPETESSSEEASGTEAASSEGEDAVSEAEQDKVTSDPERTNLHKAAEVNIDDPEASDERATDEIPKKESAEKPDHVSDKGSSASGKGKEESGVRSEEHEVLAMSLTVRNQVNGNYVRRPTNLKAKDEWSIEYTLEEVPNARRAWSLYQACQMRRKKLQEDQRHSQDDEQVDFYIRKLRQMSRAGARWRKKQDKVDKELPVRILGQDVFQNEGREA
ncbi:MAG: hypothetical protein Q9219_002220 [cf. Caloplaca sp. 3 TL-2023]